MLQQHTPGIPADKTSRYVLLHKNSRVAMLAFAPDDATEQRARDWLEARDAAISPNVSDLSDAAHLFRFMMPVKRMAQFTNAFTAINLETYGSEGLPLSRSLWPQDIRDMADAITLALLPPTGIPRVSPASEECNGAVGSNDPTAGNPC